MFLLVCLSLFGRDTQCPQFFIKGEAPDIISESIVILPNETCKTLFVTYYNSRTKNPWYSAEIMRGKTLKHINRVDSFHIDEKVKTPSPSAYSKSGYDKGHLVPCDDANSTETQYETFSMVNMAPQHPKSNRVYWKSLEEKVRAKAKLNPETKYYIITGVYGSLGSFNNINIPKYYFKIVSTETEIHCFILSNDGKENIQEVSLDILERESGLRFNVK